MQKMPIVFDCDPGHDDAVALFMAVGSERFDLRGITCVPGNNLLDKVSQNALKLTEFLGLDIPVVAGCPKPLAQECHPAVSVHGASGMEGPHLPLPKKQLAKVNAIDFLAQQIREVGGELTIVAVGPLTNIATLLLAYPELKGDIKRICIMGGSAEGGNVTPVAEFNIWHDPEAARIVFASGVPITMCGLDVTHRLYITEPEVEEIRALGRVGRLAAELFDYYKMYHGEGGVHNVIPHDAVAVCWLLDPEMFYTRSLHVEVDAGSGLSRGCTQVFAISRDMGDDSVKAEVVFDGDRDKFVQMFKHCIANLG